MNNPPIQTLNRRRARRKKILGAIFPVVISSVMIFWLFRKVDFATIVEIVRDGCRYGWLLVTCVVLVFSRSIRGIRWGFQLRAAGVKRMPAFAEMVSIYGAYALNLVITWLGEAWRCIYVSRRQDAPLSTVVGTDIGDRLSDAIIISSLIILSLFVARPVLDSFLERYAVGRHIQAFFTSPWLLVTLALIAVAMVAMLRSKSKNRYIVSFQQGARNLWDGFKVLFTMKHQLRFWVYTILIWIAYFLMTYLSFFAFPFTRDLIRPDLAYGLMPGLIVFVFGAISIAIPATGGLGPWNIAVIFALSLFGVGQSEAATFSLVVWAFQSITQIILGIIAALYVAISHRRRPQPQPLPAPANRA